MATIFRILAVLSGHKLIRLVFSQRGGGHALVTSPDLPGFSLMLDPNELENFGSMTAAVSGPLESFIKAECDAVEASKRMQIRGMRQTTDSNMVAELSAA
jgi:hypothetical protein